MHTFIEHTDETLNSGAEIYGLFIKLFAQKIWGLGEAQLRISTFPITNYTVGRRAYTLRL